MNKRKIVLTARKGVILKQLIPADALPLFSLIRRNRRHLNRCGETTSRKYPSLKSVRDSILRPLIPSRVRFGIWKDGRLMGSANLTAMTNAETMRNDIAEIGYWVGQEFCGDGLATTAVEALAGYGMRRMRFDCIVAQTRKDNVASRKVLRKAGFRWEITVGKYLHYGREKDRMKHRTRRSHK